MRQRNLLGCVIAFLVLAPAANAVADPAFTAGAPQVGGGLRYGLYMGDDDGDPPNPYGLGFGLNAGYTLDLGLYLGGEFNYFLGGEKDSWSWNIMQFGAEVGYDIGLSPAFVLRPKVGLGLAKLSYEYDLGAGATLEDSESGLMIPIGAQALYSMGGWFLTGEVRYAICSIDVADNDYSVAGLIFGAGAGVAF